MSKAASVKAIIAGTAIGLIGSALASVALSFAFQGTLLTTNSLEAWWPNSTLLLADLVSSLAFVALSGYVAARLSKNDPVLNAVITGVIQLLINMAGFEYGGNQAPFWYTATALLGVIPATYLGGKLATPKYRAGGSTASPLNPDGGRVFTNPVPLLAAAVIAIGSLAAVVVIFHGRGGGQDIAPNAAATVVEQRVAELDVKPRTFELTSEKAIRVRNAIKAGDYATAKQISADVLANSHMQNWRFYPFASFIHDIPDVIDPVFKTNLDSWIAKDTAEAMPLLIRAQYYHDAGWFRRGGRFARDTQAASLDAFQDDMKKALADADAAIRLDNGNPYSSYLKLQILHGLGLSQGLMDAFSDAIAKYPNYYPLYSIVLETLEPRWGGSIDGLYAFVDQYARPAAENSPLKLLYLGLYRSLLSSASIACTPYQSDRDKLAQCVGGVMQRIVRSGLETQVLAALQLYDHTDRYQFSVAVEDILLDMLRTSGGDVYSGAILQLAATSMHSDTQLKEDAPGHNNYVIDKAVAVSWWTKGFYDNSMQKDLETLKDIEAMNFPDEEAKDLAVADVYGYLAGDDDQLHQYADMIAYEKAAVTLGGKTGYEHLICYGYYQLKDYDDAVRACSKTIGEDSQNLLARYWRGFAYRDAGQPDAALKDWTVVADSESQFRNTAAIDMSMIYFNRNDNRSALDVLNKYTYLYNPDTANKNDMAVSYNNRCYAYMQLGELQKALDDCTASLRYGNLPDAYRKQQELVRHLAARGTNE